MNFKKVTEIFHMVQFKKHFIFNQKQFSKIDAWTCHKTTLDSWTQNFANAIQKLIPFCDNFQI